MGVQQKEWEKFVSTTYRITELHYSYWCQTCRISGLQNTDGCASFIADFSCSLYLHNYWATLPL